MLACLERLTREEEGRDALSEGDQTLGSLWETDSDGRRPLSGSSGVAGLMLGSFEGVGGAACSSFVTAETSGSVALVASVPALMLDPVS